MPANDGFESEKEKKDATAKPNGHGSCNTNDSGDLSEIHFQNVDLNDDVENKDDVKENQRAQSGEPNAEDDGKDEKTSEEKKESGEKKAEPTPMVSYGNLFRFADRFDVILMIIGTIGSLAQGAMIPVQFIIFGDLSDSFIEYTVCLDPRSNCTTIPNIEEDMIPFAYYYVGIAVAMAVAVGIRMVTYELTAERQGNSIRKAFFKSILRQEMGWFDTNDAGELNNRLSDDLNKIVDGLGRKLAAFQYCVASFICGYFLGFFYGWKLTLVILSLFPVIVISGGFLGWVITGFTTKELKAYSEAGSVAQEVFSSFRTVAAFGGEEKETERYTSRLGAARKMGEKKGLANGLGMGMFNFIMFCSYALAFWYGATLVIEKEMTGGNLLIVFFSVMVASISASQAGPSMQGVASARGAAYHLYELIDRTPVIDISSEDGVVPETLEGSVEFKDISFTYPSRPDIQILNGFTLSVPKGKRVALVGESGCGKSTVVKLIQRFYDIAEGNLSIDGRGIETYNLKWLRQHIGVVSQEPVLFATTIAENIRYGRDDATQDEIEEAAKMANAHDFISAMPQGYETLCGERGAQMSGGQKQRIAIARALVRNPTILLLDEATSALDTESESIVQEALDKAGEGRTTFIIAHRLSTVRDADMIVAVKDGAVAEIGTHDELMNKDGVYKQLVILQTIEGAEEDSTVENRNDSIKNGHQPAAPVRSISSDSEGAKHSVHSPKVNRQVSRQQSGYKRQESERVIEEEVEPAAALRIIKMSKPEWHYLLLGTFGAAINGSFPFVFAFLLGEIFGVFAKNPDIPSQRNEMEEDSEFWSLLFLALAFAMLFGNTVQSWMYSIAGEILTLRLRKQAFKSLVRQDTSYFDDPYHSTGALTSNLATHASTVQGATGSRLGAIVSSLITTVGCLALAFASGWKLALLVVAFIPFIILGAVTRMRVYFRGSGNVINSEEAGKIAVETILNIQTVAALGKEECFYEKYMEAVSEMYTKRKRKGIIGGMFAGVSQSFVLLSSAAAFRFAGYLVQNGEMSFTGVMKTVLAVQMGAMTAGQISALTPDYVKAKIAAARLFKLFDTTPIIQSDSEEGLKPSTSEGYIEFKDVTFRYPFRQDVKVLRGLNLKIEPGKTVALVGSSGCGKSTTVSLIQRLYDIEMGSVMIDGNDIRSLNVSWLRRQIGIVSQEPVLFNCSIRDNIAYGDISREMSQEEIENAAKAANIHDFINTLPKGYDSMVGDKGTLISGGQKQRIAIARALIRNPKILLLDEATSALDTESEKVVQEALDRACVGRTTLIIAHRLSTVQKADMIAVIKSGHVVEKGTHQKLLEMKGAYYYLQQAQT
ncbi:multidrug resistance protein 1-like isoform X2 [Dendronephthya gigantea]|uniref:multidrug resistance protein 1-like isoform X1 n=1 Tax=Dendronephthya gigantea TaxID=151771 RepID=UPI00106904A4|nr:multidrug resistance protein 1-like isoform X1 [Dendronephthya gigantea]XP_028400893.1 multidrug resistance protein 1-like isoform X2 [Dendronephthya gigantea]